MLPKSAWSGRLRSPHKSDGLAIHRLIAQCPPLDTNSSYCNFVQIEHFKETCVVAEQDGDIVGFLSAHVIPSRPDTIFVWQIAIDPQCQGKGLGFALLQELLRRPLVQSLQFLETTITKSNRASWALFQKLDVHLKASGQVSVFLDKQTHFANQHDTEHLFRIPLQTA